MIFHSLPSLSELLFGLLWLLFSGLIILTPFILGGLAIYVLRKKKNSENV